MTMPAKRLTEADVVITITAEDEDESPAESYMIPGIYGPGEDCDAFVEAVDEMVEKHGLWGWCEVVVSARLGPLEGFSHLCGSSYEDAEDFKADGYYPQMVEEAIAELQVQVDELYELIHIEGNS